MIDALAASLLLFCQVPVNPPKPTEIDCRIEFGKCSISLPIAGKSYWFLVDTGNTESWISARVRKELLDSNKSLALTIGPVSLSATELTKLSKYSEQSVEGDDGVLGMDVLSKLMFGIDYENEKFFVWPPNSASIQVVQTWMTGPDIVRVQTAASLYDDDNRFYVSSSYGWLCVDTGSPLALLPKIDSKQTDFLSTAGTAKIRLFAESLPDAELKVAPLLQVAPVTLRDMPVMLTSKLTEDEGGAIGTSLYGPKVLIDGPGKSVSVAYDASGKYQFVWTVKLLMMGLAQMHNGKMCIDLSHANFSIPRPKDTWAEIVSINGVRVDDLQQEFAKQDPSLAKQVRNLLAAILKGCKGEAIVDGKPMVLNLDGK